MSRTMKSTGLLLLGTVLAAIYLATSDASAASGKLAGHNVLLITLDTTRADRLGCYGYKPAKTPALDALAARGTLFQQAYAQTPLTLPSHASILTGQYPREHGVQDNGRNALGTTQPTLASVFKEHGYATGAFIGSFILDARFGLARGFDVYNDKMDEVSLATQQLDWQQPANVVTDRALEWLPQVADKPFFAWVHYYDAHQPYEPPTDFRGPDIDPYDGELAFVDTQIKRLTDWLDSAGLTQKTLVLVVGDHGEGFGEHLEKGHSDFVYDVNIHVPLIFAHPAVIPVGRRIPALVESVDLLPTVEALFGWTPPKGLLSRSLARAFADGKLEDRAVYAESLFIFYTYAWAEQRTLITPEWKYISSAKPEVYNRKDDPGERINVIEKEAKRAGKLLAELKDRYDAMVAAPTTKADLDPAALRKLSGLGYAGGTTSATAEFLTEGLLDPKDHQMTLAKAKSAQSMLGRSKSPSDVTFVIPLLRNLVQECPRTALFHNLLGAAYGQIEDHEAALAALQTSAKLDKGNGQVFTALGGTLMKLRRFSEALEHFSTAEALDDKSADMQYRYAEALLMTGEAKEAVTHYQKSIGLFPDFAEAHSRMGLALQRLGRNAEAGPAFERATVLFQQALGRKPDDADVHLRLGSVYLHSQRVSEAIAEFREVLRLDPNLPDAMVSLAAALDTQGGSTESEALLRRATTFADASDEAWHGLGIQLSNRGALDEAVAAYEKAVQINPCKLNTLNELIGYYLGAGRIADARRILETGSKNLPNNGTFHNMLAKLLATAPDERFRNGKAALEHALRVNEITGGRDPAILATVGNAHAELGDFEKAIAVASQALGLARTAGQKELAEAIEAQLESYRRANPVRDPRFSSR